MKLSAKDKRDYDAHLESKSLHAEYMEKVRAEALAQGIAQEKANTELKISEINKEVERIAKGLISRGLDLDPLSNMTGIGLSELERMVSKAC